MCHQANASLTVCQDRLGTKATHQQQRHNKQNTWPPIVFFFPFFLFFFFLRRVCLGRRWRWAAVAGAGEAVAAAAATQSGGLAVLNLGTIHFFTAMPVNPSVSPINQSVRSIDQSVSRSIDRLLNHSINPSITACATLLHSVEPPARMQSIRSQSIDRSVQSFTISLDAMRSINLCPINKSSALTQSIHQSINQSIDQSVNRSTDESINQSHSLNPSIHQAINWIPISQPIASAPALSSHCLLQVLRYSDLQTCTTVV
eukprot:COSAG06_NODE_5021_length_3784_cov_35.777476_1_plen_258_part_00